MATDCREDLIIRLRKIEGQVRGLQKMLNEDADCAKVIHQLCAARKALDKVGFIILSHRMRECLEQSSEKDARTALSEAEELFLTLA